MKIEGAGWLEGRFEEVPRGAAIASQSQQGTAALPASRPFAVRRAGFNYFADQQHYGSLAGRVLAGLQQGGQIALVTGDPPMSPLSLATALTEATAGKHTVLVIACGDDFNEEQLRRATGPSPLLLFCQADRLSDGQLSRLCSYLVSSGNGAPGVLLGRAGLAARLERLLWPHPVVDGRVIRFNFYELGRDEIDVFIRRQLCPGMTADAFSVDAINWIADLSTGDPAEVNRERAADAGNGRAALRMGESFDPAFLGRIGVYRNIGDRLLALSWYRRARDLGDTEAAQLLEKLESR